MVDEDIVPSFMVGEDVVPCMVGEDVVPCMVGEDVVPGMVGEDVVMTVVVSGGTPSEALQPRYVALSYRKYTLIWSITFCGYISFKFTCYCLQVKGE